MSRRTGGKSSNPIKKPKLPDNKIWLVEDDNLLMDAVIKGDGVDVRRNEFWKTICEEFRKKKKEFSTFDAKQRWFFLENKLASRYEVTIHEPAERTGKMESDLLESFKRINRIRVLIKNKGQPATQQDTELLDESDGQGKQVNLKGTAQQCKIRDSLGKPDSKVCSIFNVSSVSKMCPSKFESQEEGAESMDATGYTLPQQVLSGWSFFLIPSESIDNVAQRGYLQYLVEIYGGTVIKRLDEEHVGNVIVISSDDDEKNETIWRKIETNIFLPSLILDCTKQLLEPTHDVCIEFVWLPNKPEPAQAQYTRLKSDGGLPEYNDASVQTEHKTKETDTQTIMQTGDVNIQVNLEPDGVRGLRQHSNEQADVENAAVLAHYGVTMIDDVVSEGNVATGSTDIQPGYPNTEAASENDATSNEDKVDDDSGDDAISCSSTEEAEPSTTDEKILIAAFQNVTPSMKQRNLSRCIFKQLEGNFGCGESSIRRKLVKFTREKINSVFNTYMERHLLTEKMLQDVLAVLKK